MWNIAIKPGKPLAFGRLGNTPFFGLPGNPVSVGVATVVFIKPAIEVMFGIGQQGAMLSTARLNGNLGRNDERQDYLRARLSSTGKAELTVTPLEKQDSSMLASFADADCLIVRPPHALPAVIGEQIEYLSLVHSTLTL